MVFVYITCSSLKEAEHIARALLKKRLIACTNMFPIKSMFWWKGKITRANEHIIIAKTMKKNFNKIQSEVRIIHSYDVPCITLIDTLSNPEFEQWVRRETASR